MKIFRTRVFYGWWIVAATLLLNIIVNGIGTYIFSFFVKPLQNQFNWGRGEIMTAFTVNFVSMGIGQFFAGRLIDRYGARRIISAGGILMGLGLVLASTMTQLWQLYAGWIMVGLGAAAAGTLPGSLVVSNWFKAKRGLAIGIMSAGVGIGGLLMSPLVGSYPIPAFGRSAALLILAILALVIIIPLGWFVIRTKPSDMGLIPDGTDSPAKTKISPIASLSSSGMTPNEAMGSSLSGCSLGFLYKRFRLYGGITKRGAAFTGLKVPYRDGHGGHECYQSGQCFRKIQFWLAERPDSSEVRSFYRDGATAWRNTHIHFYRFDITSVVNMGWRNLLGLGIGKPAADDVNDNRTTIRAAILRFHIWNCY